MTPEELEALIERGEPAAVRDAMLLLTEKERRALAPAVVRIEKAVEKRRWDLVVNDRTVIRMGPDGKVQRPPDEEVKRHAEAQRAAWARMAAAGAAFVATATGAELIERRFHMPFAFELLVGRNQPWLREWAAKAVEKDIGFCELAYRLVVAGHCDRPESDNWRRGFVSHETKPGPDPFDDRVFREEDFWRLVEIGTALHHVDKNGQPSRMTTAILTRVADGRLSRDRLLDGTLRSLGRGDFVRGHAAPIQDLHEALAPTVDERAARVGAYLGLLSSRLPETVNFALSAVVALHMKKKLPAEALLAQVGPVLQARAKKTVLSALKLIEDAGREPRLASRAAAVATDALGQGPPEVQSRAATIVTALGDRGDEALVARVRERLASVASTVRPRLLEWLGEPAAPQRPLDVPGNAGEVAPRPPAEVPAVSSSPAALSSPSAPAPLVRARSLDEAIDLLAGAIERFESPDEMEGALAGVARFCGERPADFAARLAPLARRAEKLVPTRKVWVFTGQDLRSDLCRLARAWHQGGEVEPWPSELRRMRTFLAGRIREVAVRAAEARPTTLLATPTHLDGWIDPGVLVARALDATPDPLDAVQSLLRVGRDGRPEALAQAAAVPGEYGAALRFALGGVREGDAQEIDLWLAAEAARTGDNMEPRFTLLRHPMTLTNYMDRPFMTASETLTMRWVVTVFPADLCSYFRAGGSAILAYMSMRHALWWNAVYLEPLLRRDVPMVRAARRLLAVGLASGQTAEGGLATDVLIQVIEDGRGDPAELGDAFAMLLSAEVVDEWAGRESGIAALRANKLLKAPIVCARWAARLKDAARASPRHAAFVRELLVRALRGLPDPPHRDAVALLELLRELCAETGRAVADAETRARLERFTGSSKAAQLARSLLATPLVATPA
jgi:hypothetical protein